MNRIPTGATSRPSAARPRPTMRLAAVRRVRRQLRAWRRPRTRSSTCIRNAWRAVQRIDDRPIDPRPYAFEPNHLFQVADKGEDGIARVQRELDLALADGRPQPRSGTRFLNKWIQLSGCRFGVPRAQTMCVSTLCTDGGPENPCESKGPPFLPLAAIDQGHLLSTGVLAVAVAMMHLERPLARAQTTLALRGRELTDAGRVVPPATAGDVALRAPFTSLVSNGNCH
jgi:hypothetical protein